MEADAQGSGAFPASSDTRTPSLYSAPTPCDKIQDCTERFGCTIKGCKFKYCGKCVHSKGSSKKGCWNMMHYTDEHCSPVLPDVSQAVANIAGNSTTTTTNRVSFEDSLMDASTSDN